MFDFMALERRKGCKSCAKSEQGRFALCKARRKPLHLMDGLLDQGEISSTLLKLFLTKYEGQI